MKYFNVCGKKIRVFLSVMFVVFLAGNLFYGFSVYSEATADLPGDEDESYSSIYKLMFVINKVRREYVDSDKVTYNNIVKGALKGILRELDPFCSYMEPQSFKNMVEDTEGKEFGGVGMMVSYRDGLLIVIAPMDDSPAFKAGIKPGDVVTHIDGADTSHMNLDECVKMLKGEPGSSVKLTVERESAEQPLELTVVRENIEVSTVKGSKIVDGGIAYLRITQFNIPTAPKLDEELAALKSKGMKALVIDLRGNPGGLLNSAVEVCSRFIDTGKLVVSTEGRDKDLDNKHDSMHCRKYLFDNESGKGLPVAILIDGNSASASEIVAGCLKDYKRAVLVGERTFGKGSVQTVTPLPNDGGAIRLTTAKYYTPNRLQIHEHGIDPDIKVEMPRKEMEKVYAQRIVYPGSVKPDMKDAATDVQLERAIEVLKGICVYKLAEAEK